MKKHSGFTLIELLVVIAVIGILSAIVIGSLTSAREKGRSAAVKKAMNDMLTQGQLYYDDYDSYASATTSSRVGCFATSTFLTDATFFGDRIPSLMVLNIEDNGAPISCAISQTGKSFSMTAYIGENKFLCRDSDSNFLIESSLENSSGVCIIPPVQNPVVPVIANNAGNLSPGTLAITTNTLVSFQYGGNNLTKNFSCTNGGPSFTLGPNSTLYEYTFTVPGSYYCKRTQNGGRGIQLTVTP